MKDEKITGNNHVARLCHNKHIEDEQILPTAFHLRPGEDGLSVNWLESLKCSSRDSEINVMRGIYTKTFSVGTRAKIAVLNAGNVYEKALSSSRNLKILHDPLVNDQSHSQMFYLKDDYMEIGELILQTVQEAYPART
ncbi:MAG: hypothetical protein GY777_32345 [Candidatus Brocadiaceae bacterium]|nr:hypothetical protein [Candidatus Brocadiaceae bacterium]